MSGDHHHCTDNDVDAALRNLETAYDRAVDLIAYMYDPHDAFSRATRLRELADEFVGRAAVLRANTARRIRDTDKLSVGALAKQLGISKARAEQLLRIPRRIP